MTVTYKQRPERMIFTGRQPRAKAPRIDYADMLEQLIAREGWTGWLREYHFAAHACGGMGPGLRARLKDAGLKDWRFDAAHLGLKVAIEVDGGNRMATINPRTGQPVAVGRHTQADDYRKRNSAARLGWRILSYTPDMLRSGEWLEDVKAIMWG